MTPKDSQGKLLIYLTRLLLMPSIILQQKSVIFMSLNMMRQINT
jgi:hypothetical protein